MRVVTFAVCLGITASASMARAQPAPDGPWMVFFDWSKSELRRDDAETLDRVADNYRARPVGRLQLAGHTDRSGSARVNRAAGLLRAQTVRAELEKRGVPRNAISIVSFGEDRPLVATEDGVREVQNRRVEISIEE